MQLFEVMPASMFTVLTSKNRDVYVAALFALRQAFKEDITIDKNVLAAKLVASLHDSILNIDAEAEDAYTDETYKDAMSLARFIIRKFKDTGWIEIEYSRYDQLKELVTIPPYAIKLINLLYDFVSEEVKEYDSYMYSMYSALLNANNLYNEYRYISLTFVSEKIAEFEDALKTLFHNLRRKHTNLGNLKTINQMLEDHFDSYQEKILKQIYLPLKTRDSVNRFKGSILDILNGWLRDVEAIDSMVETAMRRGDAHNEDEAKDIIITKISRIVDKLFDLEDLIILIDERNNTYVTNATEKMRHLMRKDKSIEAITAKIIAHLAYEKGENEDFITNYCQDAFCLKGSGYLDQNSLFNRAASTKEDASEPLPVVFPENIEELEKLANNMRSSDREQFSHQNIIRFMRTQMEELDEINAQDLVIENTNDFILVMYSFIKGYDQSAFYRLQLLNGQLTNSNYSLPNANFKRKRGERRER